MRTRYPCLFLYHLENEGIISAFQEPPRLLMPCCVVPAANTGIAEVPYEDGGLWIWGCSCPSTEGLICLVFLVQWPAAEYNCNIGYLCLPFNSKVTCIACTLPCNSIHFILLLSFLRSQGSFSTWVLCNDLHTIFSYTEKKRVRLICKREKLVFLLKAAVHLLHVT